MTVNELYKAWIHSGNPNADCLVWDRSTGEYILSTKKPLPNQDVKRVEEIENMEASCFYCSYDKDTDTETLTINVGNYEDDKYIKEALI